MMVRFSQTTFNQTNNPILPMKKNQRIVFLLAGISTLFAACNHTSGTKAGSNNDTTAVINYQVPDSANFKDTLQGKQVGLYILKNKNNTTVAITNFGGRLVSLLVPDKNGKLTDVILGHDDLKGYEQKKNENYYGAIIGRYGNRIAKGKFTLEGKSYQLDVNNGANTLHGGYSGFYSRVFTAKKISGQQLELSYLSKDGEGGYPGNLTVKVVYTLTDDNALKIEYTATTDKTTVVNLTNHAYFNLNGAGTKTMTDDSLKIDADNYLPVDTTLIPTGKLQPVKGTPFDFTTFKTIGADIEKADDQIKNGKGFDHNFVLNKHNITTSIATVKSPETGIVMDVYTTEPGLQFYSGNFPTGINDGKGKAVYPHRSAFCLETQHFPDSPNQLLFPSTVLKRGEVYHTTTIYKFSAK